MIRAYTVKDVCEKLAMSRATFYVLRKAGKLTCLEELQPRYGRRAKYRAELIDAYLENRLGEHQRKYFQAPARRLRVVGQ